MSEWIEEEMKKTMKIPFFWLLLGMLIWIDYQIVSEWISVNGGNVYFDDKLNQIKRWKEYLIKLLL